jgi:transaldolase
MAQDLLWASTGTKNPKYSDVIYVESLIGKNTINTVPDATLAAFRDHGNVAYTLADNINYAEKILEKANTIVNLNELGEKLQQDGLALFIQAFHDLIELMR